MVDAVSASLPPAYSSSNSGAQGSVPASASDTSATPPQPPSSSKKNAAFDGQALDQIAQRLVSLDSRLAISHDNVIQRFIYKFVNPNSGKVLQQYPQKMTLDTLHAMAAAYQRFLDEHA